MFITSSLHFCHVILWEMVYLAFDLLKASGRINKQSGQIVV